MGRNRLCFFFSVISTDLLEKEPSEQKVNPGSGRIRCLLSFLFFSLLARRGVTLRSPTPGDSLLEELVWKLSGGRSSSTLPLKPD